MRRFMGLVAVVSVLLLSSPLRAQAPFPLVGHHGRTLATSFTTPECGIKLWDLARGGAPQILRQAEPRCVLTNVRYSPDGRWLAATATTNSTSSFVDPTERLVLWDLEGYPTDTP